MSSRRAAQAALLDDALRILQDIGGRYVAQREGLHCEDGPLAQQALAILTQLTFIAAQPPHPHPEVLADPFRTIPLLASRIQGLPQTSTVQIRNRTIGVAMILSKKFNAK